MKEKAQEFGCHSSRQVAHVQLTFGHLLNNLHARALKDSTLKYFMLSLNLETEKTPAEFERARDKHPQNSKMEIHTLQGFGPTRMLDTLYSPVLLLATSAAEVYCCFILGELMFFFRERNHNDLSFRPEVFSLRTSGIIINHDSKE